MENITVDQLIKKLQALKPSLRKLPVMIETPNGMLVEPQCKAIYKKYESQISGDDPEHMIMTWRNGFN